MIKKFTIKSIAFLLVIGSILLNVNAPHVIQANDANGGNKSFDYTCIASTSIAGDIEIGMKVSPNISLPETVEPGEAINLSDISANIEIDLTGSLDGLRGLINPFNGHVNHFNIVSQGTEKNVLGEGGAAIPETAHEAGDTFIPFTVSGIDTAFDGGEEDVEFSVGEIEAIINAKLAAMPVDLTVTCTPPA